MVVLVQIELQERAAGSLLLDQLAHARGSLRCVPQIEGEAALLDTAKRVPAQRRNLSEPLPVVRRRQRADDRKIVGHWSHLGVRYNLKSLEVQVQRLCAMKIGTLAERTGTNVPTIRYYESIGLLPQAARQEGRQRVYGEGDVERLTFIRRCRDFGFSVEQVRSLEALGRDPTRSCLELRDLAASHLTDVQARIRELKALARSLAAFVDSCDATCAGGAGPDCTILDDLGRVPRGCGGSRTARQPAT